MKRLRILHLEDNPLDSELIADVIREGGIEFDLDRVDARESFLEKLHGGTYDIILCDYTLPSFSGREALEIVRANDKLIPFIYVSGTIGEDNATESLKLGATDFVLKDRLLRVVSAIRRAFDEMEEKKRRIQAEGELKKSQERYEYAMLATNDGILDFDLETGENYVSARCRFLLGYEQEAVLDNPEAWLARVHPYDKDRVVDLISALLQGKMRVTHFEFRTYNTDGTNRWIAAAVLAVVQGQKVTRIVGSLTDISTQKRAEERAAESALYDPLTALPNRTLLIDRIRGALTRAHEVALIMIDVDNLHTLNTTYGHSYGDACLRCLAERLLSFLGSKDTAARTGADEFMILVEEPGAESIEAMMKSISRALQTPMNLLGHESVVSACRGVVETRTSNRDVEGLIRDVEIATSRAKIQGRGTIVRFDEGMRVTVLASIEIRNDLPRALLQGEFRLHFQPIVRSTSGEITGAEALLRWHHPTRGLIPPVEFIPLAEETGAIIEIGGWIIGEACREAALWKKKTGRDFSISVNFSGRQFQKDDLAELIGSELSRNNIAPENFRMEITESIAMRNTDYTYRILAELRALGVGISIDDFGTGYSSLAYLQRFPIDALKIDRTFVKNVADDVDAAVIVSTIIQMAHNLRLKVTAEGVETSEQWKFLLLHGCDELQGYFFGKPVPGEDFLRLLEEHNPSPPG